jgi:hypothetical protein
VSISAACLCDGGATNDVTVAAAGESDIVRSSDDPNDTALETSDTLITSYMCTYKNELEDVYLQIKMNQSNRAVSADQ